MSLQSCEIDDDKNYYPVGEKMLGIGRWTMKYKEQTSTFWSCFDDIWLSILFEYLTT